MSLPGGGWVYQGQWVCPEEVCARGSVCPGVGMSRGYPPPWTWGLRDTMGYGRQAGSTHLTGMRSCCLSLGVCYDLRLLHFNNGSMFPKERGEQKKKR